MSEPTDNTPTADEIAALREEVRKAKEFRARTASTVGLAADAADDAILASLGNIESTVAQRTTGIAAERDAARQQAAQVLQERADERIEAAIVAELKANRIIPENIPDAVAMMKPLFTIKDGRIVTRTDAANTLPGVEPRQFIVGQLQAMRCHWWPDSKGGGARGSHSTMGGGLMPGHECFQRGPSWNVTAQHRYELMHGAKAAAVAESHHGRGGR